MIKSISNIIKFILPLMVVFCLMCMANNADASIFPSADCKNIAANSYSSHMDTSATTELIDARIMDDMKNIMESIYTQLSKVFMLSHALVCFAIDIDYSCVQIKAPVINVAITPCMIKLPNFGLLITGCILYAVGILLTMSIGMFFIDICFKIGFAVMMLPIALALWPFPPTKSKIADVFSIILRNAMTFIFICVGVAFAVILLTDGMYEDGGWDGFWNAIEDLKAENIADNFSLFSTHVIVVLFCIAFAFKIISSSITKYLGYFFNDNAFGSESPMMAMGTQLVGLAAANTIKPAASYVSDVATHQTGRLISGIGGAVSQLGSAQGRQQLGQSIKKTAGKAVNPFVHPIKTYNSAMQSVGRGVNKGIQGVGDVVQGVANAAHIGLTIPGLFRKADNDRMNAKIDNAFTKLGNKAEHFIAKGGSEMLKNTAAKGVAGASNIFRKKGDKLTGADIRQGMHEVRQDAADIAQAAKTGIKSGAGVLGQKISSTSVAQTLSDIYKASDQAPITLSPTRGAMTIFNGMHHPVKSVRKLSSLFNQLKDADVDTKVILKSSGQILVRSVKDSLSDVKHVGEKTASSVGKIIQGFGNYLGDNSKKANKGYTSYSDIVKQQQMEEDLLEEERLKYENQTDEG